jgi:hypothetical protein
MTKWFGREDLVQRRPILLSLSPFSVIIFVSLLAGALLFAIIFT